MNAQTRFFRTPTQQIDDDDMDDHFMEKFRLVITSIVSQQGVVAAYNFIIAIAPVVEALINSRYSRDITVRRPNN